MIFNLFGKNRKEKEALQRTADRSKARGDRKQQEEAFRKDRIFDSFEWHYIDEIQSLSYPTIRTFEVLADSKVIGSDFFNIKEKRLVCFADQTGSLEFENYIANKIDDITRNLAEKDWSFVHKPLKIDDVDLFNLPYFFPFAFWDKGLLSELNDMATQEITGNQILQFYNYDGPVKTGFISIAENKFVFIAKKEEESIADFVQQYLAFMPKWNHRVFGLLPPGYDFELEDEARKIIDQIKLNLDKLKENGQFFAIAPTLLKLRKRQKIHPKSAGW